MNRPHNKQLIFLGETKNPTRNELRNFGLIVGSAIAILFGLLLPLLRSHPVPLWPWIVAGVFAGVGVLAPTTLGPVFRVWMRFGHVMGVFNTRLIMGLLFFVVITPIGFVMRLFGWDPMRRRPVPGSSHRVLTPNKPSRNVERPF